MLLPSPAVRRNETLIRAYYDELFGKGRVELIPELLAEDYVNHSPSPGLPPGRAGVAVVVAALREGLPDLRYEIQDLVVSEDAVAARTLLTGTHAGPLFGIAPTGRRVAVQQIAIERIRDGRIVAHHRVTDELSMMRQLGAVQ